MPILTKTQFTEMHIHREGQEEAGQLIFRTKTVQRKRQDQYDKINANIEINWLHIDFNSITINYLSIVQARLLYNISGGSSC